MKTKTGHTPGPWVFSGTTVYKEKEYEYCNRIAEVNHRVIYDSFGYSESDPSEVKANARLIAAAPEQNEALHTISDGINTAVDNMAEWSKEQLRQHLWNLRTVAYAAIAKAEGR